MCTGPFNRMRYSARFFTFLTHYILWEKMRAGLLLCNRFCGTALQRNSHKTLLIKNGRLEPIWSCLTEAGLMRLGARNQLKWSPNPWTFSQTAGHPSSCTRSKLWTLTSKVIYHQITCSPGVCMSFVPDRSSTQLCVSLGSNGLPFDLHGGLPIIVGVAAQLNAPSVF